MSSTRKTPHQTGRRIITSGGMRGEPLLCATTSPDANRRKAEVEHLTGRTLPA